MQRKRLTQRFPFLLPLRRKQRTFCFYLKMYFDQNKYAQKRETRLLPYEYYSTDSFMLNESSGFPMEYQYNKVYNLKLAAKTMDKLIIRPGETFSFYQLVRHADRNERFKDGLTLVNGQIIRSYGGGLCQLSNLLYWMFLHSPLKITERHGHAVEAFPTTTEDLPKGTDATVNEGWLDLKAKNETAQCFQIALFFDETYLYGQIMGETCSEYEYEIYNKSITYYKNRDGIFQKAAVNCIKTNRESKKTEDLFLYDNVCQIGYELPDTVEVKEEH